MSIKITMLKALEEPWLNVANNGHVFVDISDDEDNTDEEPTEGQRLVPLTEAQIREMNEGFKIPDYILTVPLILACLFLYLVYLLLL